MSPRGERLSGQPAVQRAGQDHPRTDEQAEYRLTTTQTIERDSGGDIEPDGRATVLVTGRHVEIRDVEADPITVPHTALNSVRRERRLVRRWFVLDTDEETYRLVPEGGDDTGTVVDYVREAVWAWRDADRLLSDAREHVTAMGRAIESGDLDQATRERRQATRALARARGAAETADVAGEAITAEADSIETEAARTRVQRHLARATSVRARATDHHEARRYDQAHAAYRTALDHVETARSVAEDHDFREASAIATEHRQLREALAELEAEPLARAQQALRAVRGADDARERFEALRVAIDRYRTVVETGCGTPAATFDGETAAVRMQISWLVAQATETARSAADALADHARASDDEDVAADHYREAGEVLATAADLARQYRQGDAEALERRKGEIERARAGVEWQWGGT